ncbi:hypothetical protein ACHAW5_008244 [Stephanodiscus triporus]|uniref:Uncharacterized protein n=1 Tax=Stephanodiscus triporus TaxID=2934178 RepID=A0ABD3PWX0_9STRA
MLIVALLMAALVPRARAFSFSYHNLITAQASTTTLYDKHDNVYGTIHTKTIVTDRRKFATSVASICLASSTLPPSKAVAEDAMSTAASSEVQVVATGDVKRLFNEGRAFEAQGNILAAQRLYAKVTNIAPRFIYGWSNLGNTLVAQGQLREADESYSKAVALCEENLKQTEASFGTRRCDDLYLILLNRGSVRLNNNMPKEALSDLTNSNTLRARPDATILQNLARAQEINSFYSQSDKSYTTAISMTANEVNPFWLRSSMVKYQLGDSNGAMDLIKRVSNRFPEAPEVRAAYAVLLWDKGEEDAARKKFLEIPDRARARYSDAEYLNKVIVWPPKMKEVLGYLTKAVGDRLV